MRPVLWLEMMMKHPILDALAHRRGFHRWVTVETQTAYTIYHCRLCDHAIHRDTGILITRGAQVAIRQHQRHHLDELPPEARDVGFLAWLADLPPRAICAWVKLLAAPSEQGEPDAIDLSG